MEPHKASLDFKKKNWKINQKTHMGQHNNLKTII